MIFDPTIEGLGYAPDEDEVEPDYDGDAYDEWRDLKWENEQYKEKDHEKRD